MNNRSSPSRFRIAQRHLMWLFSLAFFTLTPAEILATSENKLEPKSDETMVVYEVNKRVSNFPEQEDLSTPESAYVVINRLLAQGGRGADWNRIYYRGKGLGKVKKPSSEIAGMWRNAMILEVRVYKGKIAVVFAQPEIKPGDSQFDRYNKFDSRTVVLIDGRWLNMGQSGDDTLEKVRKAFEAKKDRLLEMASVTLAEDLPEPVRPRIEDPEAHLKRFVEFLEENRKDPKDFVLKALESHRVVLMGETHHRPRYWAFNSSLVKDTRFADAVGVIYMELAANNQPLIDQFLAAVELDTEPVIDTLRSFSYMGWPDKPMLDFFATVWRTNQTLPPQKRLRIVLVDMQRPWDKIKKRADLAQYRVNRDEFMAQNILRDLRDHPEDRRNALFAVGCGHAMLDLKRADAKTSVRSAGWHLRQNLGIDAVYAILQHGPSQTNMGEVHGRVCLGLFDNAFAAIDNRPIAFALKSGPFGEQRFDRLADLRTAPTDTYADGYSAYLFLCPLEDEIFSPLIRGFYTKEHMKEIDRRFRLMYGKPWHEAYRREKTDVKNFVAWMSGSSGSWGQPRRWIRALGPMNAWHFGKGWQAAFAKDKHKFAVEHPEVIVDVAKGLFDAIRNADYSNPSDWRDFPDPEHEYQARQWIDKWVKWICENFKRNPIEVVQLGEVFATNGLPTVPYKLTLKDGAVLEGNLPFFYNAQSGRWTGTGGLDWHLKGERNREE